MSIHTNHYNVGNLPNGTTVVLEPINPARIREVELPESISELTLLDPSALPALAELLKRVKITECIYIEYCYFEDEDVSRRDFSPLQQTIPCISVWRANRNLYPAEHIELSLDNSEFVVDHPELVRTLDISGGRPDEYSWRPDSFQSLTTLVLNHMELTESMPPICAPIEDLCLNDVQLVSTTIPKLFPNLSKLRILTIQDSVIKPEHDFPKLTSLKRLSIDSDCVDAVVDKCLPWSPVEELYIPVNEHILRLIESMPQLKKLYCYSNDNFTLIPPVSLEILFIPYQPAHVCIQLERCTNLCELVFTTHKLSIDKFPDSLAFLTIVSVDEFADKLLPSDIKHVEIAFKNVRGEIPDGFIPDNVERLIVKNATLKSIPKYVKKLELKDCIVESGGDSIPNTVTSLKLNDVKFPGDVIPPLPDELDYLSLMCNGSTVTTWPSKVGEIYLSFDLKKLAPPHLRRSSEEQTPEEKNVLPIVAATYGTGCYIETLPNGMSKYYEGEELEELFFKHLHYVRVIENAWIRARRKTTPR